MTTTSRLDGRSSLQLVSGASGSSHLERREGDAYVLTVERRRAPRFLTYDTGLIETLFVEIGPDQDLEAETVTLTRWRSIGVQYGSMRLLYLSRTATGTIVLQRGIERRFLRSSTPSVTGTLALQFDAPIVDIQEVGALRLDWTFSFHHP